jgi:hypothetical protein
LGAKLRGARGAACAVHEHARRALARAAELDVINVVRGARELLAANGA